MRKNNLRSLLGFVLLAVGVFIFREAHGGIYAYVIASLLVIAFWYLNGLSFAGSSLRTILMLSLTLGAMLLGVRMLFPSTGDSAKMGLLIGSDLNPAVIANLKDSHEIALELYLDHKPTLEDRYFKVGTLASTQDGIHYISKKSDLESRLSPKSSEWVRQNLTGNLDGDLKSIETWFKEDFSYTLSPGLLPSKHPLDEFLFESKKGFCEHYAASLASLLKLKGYKAQVIVGYAGGSWNPLFHRLIFEESDSHAWVEVLEPNTKTWRLVDPTEWVMPGEMQKPGSNWGPWAVGLAFVLFLLVLIFLFVRPVDSLDALLKKVGRLEQKRQLRSEGMTLSERMARLTSLYPKRAARIQQSLSLYLESHYRNEPTKLSKRKLNRSIARW